MLHTGKPWRDHNPRRHQSDAHPKSELHSSSCSSHFPLRIIYRLNIFAASTQTSPSPPANSAQSAVDLLPPSIHRRPPDSPAIPPAAQSGNSPDTISATPPPVQSPTPAHPKHSDR